MFNFRTTFTAFGCKERIPFVHLGIQKATQYQLQTEYKQRRNTALPHVNKLDRNEFSLNEKEW